MVSSGALHNSQLSYTKVILIATIYLVTKVDMKRSVLITLGGRVGGGRGEQGAWKRLYIVLANVRMS